jgi:hypothetical protein
MIYIYTLLVATSIYIYILYICMLVYICLRRYFITLFTKVCSITYEGTYFLRWYETYVRSKGVFLASKYKFHS